MSKQLALSPVPSDDTIADFEIARAEGWHALGLLARSQDERDRCAFNIREALDRAKQAGDERYDRENELPFIAPDDAIRALRLALRALLGSNDGARRDAIEAIGRALIGVEAPE
jgi:hypothetical protein